MNHLHTERSSLRVRAGVLLALATIGWSIVTFAILWLLGLLP